MLNKSTYSLILYFLAVFMLLSCKPRGDRASLAGDSSKPFNIVYPALIRPVDGRATDFYSQHVSKFIHHRIADLVQTRIGFNPETRLCAIEMSLVDESQRWPEFDIAPDSEGTLSNFWYGDNNVLKKDSAKFQIGVLPRVSLAVTMVDVISAIATQRRVRDLRDTDVKNFMILDRSNAVMYAEAKNESSCQQFEKENGGFVLLNALAFNMNNKDLMFAYPNLIKTIPQLGENAANNFYIQPNDLQNNTSVRHLAPLTDAGRGERKKVYETLVGVLKQVDYLRNNLCTSNDPSIAEISAKLNLSSRCLSWNGQNGLIVQNAIDSKRIYFETLKKYKSKKIFGAGPFEVVPDQSYFSAAGDGLHGYSALQIQHKELEYCSQILDPGVCKDSEDIPKKINFNLRIGEGEAESAKYSNAGIESSALEYGFSKPDEGDLEFGINAINSTSSEVVLVPVGLRSLLLNPRTLTLSMREYLARGLQRLQIEALVRDHWSSKNKKLVKNYAPSLLSFDEGVQDKYKRLQLPFDPTNDPIKKLNEAWSSKTPSNDPLSKALVQELFEKCCKNQIDPRRGSMTNKQVVFSLGVPARDALLENVASKILKTFNVKLAGVFATREALQFEIKSELVTQDFKNQKSILPDSEFAAKVDNSEALQFQKFDILMDIVPFESLSSLSTDQVAAMFGTPNLPEGQKTITKSGPLRSDGVQLLVDQRLIIPLYVELVPVARSQRVKEGCEGSSWPQKFKEAMLCDYF